MTRRAAGGREVRGGGAEARGREWRLVPARADARSRGFAGAFASAGGRLIFLHDLTVSPSEAMPQRIDARTRLWRLLRPIRARRRPGQDRDLPRHSPRQGLPGAAERRGGGTRRGAIGMMTIADPGFTVEPPRWPYAYARTVTLAGAKVTQTRSLRLTLNAQSLGQADRRHAAERARR